MEWCAGFLTPERGDQQRLSVVAANGQSHWVPAKKMGIGSVPLYDYSLPTQENFTVPLGALQEGGVSSKPFCSFRLSRPHLVPPSLA